jgi:crotonobetaine/carnitine-CoA ligase
MLTDQDYYLSYEYIRKRFPFAIRDSWNIKEVIEQTASLGERVYLIDAPSGKSYSYKTSNQIANQVANSLTKIGLKKGDRIGIYMTNKPMYIFTLFAAAKLGLIEVPINTNFRATEITYMVDKAEISTIVTDEDPEFLANLSQVADNTTLLKNIVIDGVIDEEDERFQVYSLEQMMTTAAKTDPAVEIKESDHFSILFTSGTTGLPKGAITTHKTAVLAAKSLASLPLDHESRNYNCLPLFHTNAQIYSALGVRCLSGSLVISDRFSPKKFWKEIIEYDCTYFNALGSILQILESATEPVPNHPAKMVMVGGTPKDLWKRFEQKFGVDVYEGFAMTEAPVLFQNCHPDKSQRIIGSCGKPVFFDLGRKVKVVNDQNEEVRIGTGEMLQKGDGFITKGYWNAPEAEKEAFDEEGWFRTGDLVKVDEEGNFYFVDRNKFMIRVAGENVSAFEVEEVIHKHPSVAQCAVVPVPDQIKGEEIKAFIKLTDRASLFSFNEIVQLCADQLAHFKVPRYYELVEEFPRTPTERIQKIALKEEEKNKQDHGWDRNIEMPDWRKIYY